MSHWHLVPRVDVHGVALPVQNHSAAIWVCFSCWLCLLYSSCVLLCFHVMITGSLHVHYVRWHRGSQRKTATVSHAISYASMTHLEVQHALH